MRNPCLSGRFSFSELDGLVCTFWSHLPRSLANLLFSQAVVSVVALCDSVLYKAVVKAVLPSPSLPGSLASDLGTRQPSEVIFIIFRR